MKVELSRFRVKPGKSERVDDWLKTLNGRIDEALQTFDREQMKFEVIFREIIDGSEYLYWFSVQGEDGEPVATSPFDLDKQHIAFWNECIDDHDYCRHDAQPQVVMVPTAVAQAMDWKTPTESATPFQRKEIIYKRKFEAE
jgi:Family of unknown function (DUF6176)